MADYNGYAKHIGAPQKVLTWITARVEPYLKDHSENQGEIEHIVDYLASPDAPNNITAMTYEQATQNAEKWLKTLQKRGEYIKEVEADIEVVLDFEDGFKIVKLIGKNAFDREGYLMAHCVGSYYERCNSGKTEIYSLRDKNNMPHATMEKDQQVKGKGNGDIHPKYVGYVVKFLEHVGMTVGDSEMRHLGYINVERFKSELAKNTDYFNSKYVPTSQKLYDRDGDEFASFELLNVIPLLTVYNEKIKINFELPSFIKLSFERLVKKIKATKGSNATSGNYAPSATSGYGAPSATSGDRAPSATSGDYAPSATSGDYAPSATSGYGAHSATSGDRAPSATSGYGAHSATSGDDGIAVAIGRKAKAKASLECFIVLAEWHEGQKFTDAKPLTVVSARVDGKKIKANQWYKLVDGKFVETDDSNE